MGARRRAREHALKMLYQWDVAGSGQAGGSSAYWSLEPESDADVRCFAEELASAARAEREVIDSMIASASHHWRVDRMDAVERNILRLAVAEMRMTPPTPHAVVIDEAVDLARSYGGRESHAFVNGILEAVRRKLAS